MVLLSVFFYIIYALFWSIVCRRNETKSQIFTFLNICLKCDHPKSNAYFIWALRMSNGLRDSYQMNFIDKLRHLF